MLEQAPIIARLGVSYTGSRGNYIPKLASYLGELFDLGADCTLSEDDVTPSLFEYYNTTEIVTNESWARYCDSRLFINRFAVYAFMTYVSSKMRPVSHELNEKIRLIFKQCQVRIGDMLEHEYHTYRLLEICLPDVEHSSCYGLTYNIGPRYAHDNYHHINLLDWMLDYDVNVISTDKYGNTLLHYLGLYSDKLLEKFIEQGGVLSIKNKKMSVF